MKVTYCDICHEVIKPGKQKYVLGVHTMTQPQSKDNEGDLRESVMKNNSYYSPSIELYEVCGECKKVLENFFHIRKEDLLKLQKSIEKMWKKKTGEV